jgi:putative FmdB family regulatory protein
MPRYYYHCNSCGEEFEIRHGMSETQEECLRCSVIGSLIRVPQLIQKPEQRKDQSTSKSRVVDAIEENRQLLKKMKKEGRLDDCD